VTLAQSYLERLHGQARNAQTAEAEFRREAVRQTKALEEARTYAFRRYHLVKDVVMAMRPHAEEAAAVAAAQAQLCHRFGWPIEPDPRYQPILDAFAPVAAAFYLAALPELELPCDPAAALEAFERWFEARSGRSIWSLLDQPAADTPVVDF
jgi:hypothetical protein